MQTIKKTNDLTFIIEEYTPLVKRIAHHLIAKLPASVQVDDLIQAGMMGLLEASANFDDTKGASFSTFAGIRIRGGMLDDIRKGDWTPRSVHRNARAIAEAVEQANIDEGHSTDAAVAGKMGVSVRELHRMQADINSGKMVGIEDLGVSEDALADEQRLEQNVPVQGLQQAQFQKALAWALINLPEREALVLSLYYDDELNLKDIGGILNVSESRISQIHSQATQKLNTKLASWQGEGVQI